MNIQFVKPEVKCINIEAYAPVQMIEKAARISHKSESELTIETAHAFIEKLLNKQPNRHMTPFEFGKFAGFKPSLEYNINGTTINQWYKAISSHYAFTYDRWRESNPINSKDGYIINGSAMVQFLLSPTIRQKHFGTCEEDAIPKICHYLSNWYSSFDYVNNPINVFYPTFEITCSIGIARELLRHRLVSAVQESTRYCKYNDEMKFILDETVVSSSVYRALADTYHQQAEAYSRLTDLTSPQFARDCLPLGLATTLIIQFDAASYLHFLRLRTATDAHPDMRRLAQSMEDMYDSMCTPKVIGPFGE